jgi:recombinational DNA repair ATPase RecF
MLELLEHGGKLRARLTTDHPSDARMSEGEISLVIMAIAIAAAEVASQAGPTLLIIDGFFASFDRIRFESMLDRLADPENQSQSLITHVNQVAKFRQEWNTAQLTVGADGLTTLEQ